MKSLWFISILFLLIAGCVPIKPLNVTRDKSRITHYASPVTNNLFKATLDIKKHHLTGLLLIKRMDAPPPPPQTEIAPPPTPSQTGIGEKGGIYRIVFANEMGMTFFDLEIQPDSFKVVSCFESLNKKALMKIFETDFRLLAGIDPVQNEKVYRQKATNNQILYSKSGRYKIWQTYSPSGDTLYSTAGKSSFADPVIIMYFNYKAGFPSKITIKNPVIGMNMSLRLLKRL